MNKKKTNCVIMCFACLILSSCAHNFNPLITDLLETDSLDQKLHTHKIDLSTNGNCPGTIPLRIINVEKRNDRYKVFDNGSYTGYIIPNIFVDSIVKYIEEKMIASNLVIDNESTEIINVSLENMETDVGVWSIEATSSLEITIPKINFTKVYGAVEGSGLGDYAIAYTTFSSDKTLGRPCFSKICSVSLKEDPKDRAKLTSRMDRIRVFETGWFDLKRSFFGCPYLGNMLKAAGSYSASQTN